MKLENLTKFIAAILKPKGRIVGTGFFLSPKVLVTCKHVVRGDQSISQNFHLKTVSGQLFHANLMGDDLPNIDAAIFEIDETRLLDEPITFGAHDGSVGHRISTFGFPELNTNGLWAAGVVVGVIQDENGYPLIQLDSAEISPGFSGSPVFDHETRSIIGMVTNISRPNQFGRLNRVAFALPMSCIASVVKNTPIVIEWQKKPHQNILRLLYTANTDGTQTYVSERSICEQLNLDTQQILVQLNALHENDLVEIRQYSVGARIIRSYRITAQGIRKFEEGEVF